MDLITDLVSRLAAARADLRATRDKPTGRSYDAYFAASAVCLDLERQLAAARGEEHAVAIDFPVEWDCGAPMPHLLRSGHKTFLIFLLSEPDPAWDGTTATLVDPAGGQPEALALVEFFGCQAAKLGSPNDEVFGGHPLSGRGLDPYTAQRVVNSRWIAELDAINSVHPRYELARRRDLIHFIFWFHDDTFECIARSFAVEVFRESFAEVLTRACGRLVDY